MILNEGRLAAEGTVQELIASRTGGVRYVVEAEGQGVADALSSLAGVTGHSVDELDGRVRVELIAGDTRELRPEIFGLARDRGWTLWELHREKASLEQLFRTLTAGDAEESSADLGEDPGPVDETGQVSDEC